MIKRDPSVFLIHCIPYNCGSMIRGQRLQEVKIAAFSSETSSVGRLWLFQSAMIASSASNLMGLISSCIGIFSSLARATHFYIKSVLYLLENGPAYEMNAAVIKTSPLSVYSFNFSSITWFFHLTFSLLNPLTNLFASSSEYSISSWRLTTASFCLLALSNSACRILSWPSNWSTIALA